MKAVSGMSVIVFLEVYLEIKAKLVDYQKIGQKKVVFMVYFKNKSTLLEIIYLFIFKNKSMLCPHFISYDAILWLDSTMTFSGQSKKYCEITIYISK